MRVIYFLTAILMLVILSCGKKENYPGQVSESEAIETQRNVNRYFHEQIIPKLKQFWGDMPDTGKSITLHYTYVRKKDRWLFNQMEKMESSLSGHSDSLVVLLMAKAVVTTSFPVEPRMKNDSVFHLYWTWPVPFPEGTFNMTSGEFTAARPAGAITGGCDGHGAKAYCKACADNLKDCITVCVGGNRCEGDGRSCAEYDVCASGGPFRRLASNYQ